MNIFSTSTTNICIKKDVLPNQAQVIEPSKIAMKSDFSLDKTDHVEIKDDITSIEKYEECRVKGWYKYHLKAWRYNKKHKRNIFNLMVRKDEYLII